MSLLAFHGYCDHMLEKTIVECGTIDNDFYITFNDKTSMFFYAKDSLLSLSLYVPKEIQQ
jgi:hypothetical protein